MRRIVSVLTVVAVMVAMVVASALPTFADPGQQGHLTEETTGDCSTEACTIDITRSGRNANELGGPGHGTFSATFDPTADPVFTSDSSSSGANPLTGGGGYCEVNTTISEDGQVTTTPTTEHGSSPPCAA